MVRKLLLKFVLALLDCRRQVQLDRLIDRAGNERIRALENCEASDGALMNSEGLLEHEVAVRNHLRILDLFLLNWLSFKQT